jgi:hypothetical protein
MTVRVVDQAEEHFLDLVLAINYSLRLFTNDVESGLTTAQKDALTEASFTEATFTGYAAKTLTGGAWTTTPGNPGSASYAVQAFTSTADQTPETVYGYYVLRSSDSKLEWYGYFAAPGVVQYNSESVVVTPALTLADTSD